MMSVVPTAVAWPPDFEAHVLRGIPRTLRVPLLLLLPMPHPRAESLVISLRFIVAYFCPLIVVVGIS
jgi:hypothetical protein